MRGVRDGGPEAFPAATDDIHAATIDSDSHKLLKPPQQVSSTDLQALSLEFSADGKSLAYYVRPTQKRTDEGWLYPPGRMVVLSLTTGQEREITLSPNYSDGGDWPRIRLHPDGGSAVMRGRSEAGVHGLFQVDMETGKLSQGGTNRDNHCPKASSFQQG